MLFASPVDKKNYLSDVQVVHLCTDKKTRYKYPCVATIEICEKVTNCLPFIHFAVYCTRKEVKNIKELSANPKQVSFY